MERILQVLVCGFCFCDHWFCIGMPIKTWFFPNRSIKNDSVPRRGASLVLCWCTLGAKRKIFGEYLERLWRQKWRWRRRCAT